MALWQLQNSKSACAPSTRPYALSGELAKARAAYEHFFALWKDADIPILKQAKAESARLSMSCGRPNQIALWEERTKSRRTVTLGP